MVTLARAKGVGMLLTIIEGPSLLPHSNQRVERFLKFGISLQLRSKLLVQMFNLHQQHSTRARDRQPQKTIHSYPIIHRFRYVGGLSSQMHILKS